MYAARLPYLTFLYSSSILRLLNQSCLPLFPPSLFPQYPSLSLFTPSPISASLVTIPPKPLTFSLPGGKRAIFRVSEKTSFLWDIMNVRLIAWITVWCCVLFVMHFRGLAFLPPSPLSFPYYFIFFFLGEREEG